MTRFYPSLHSILQPDIYDCNPSFFLRTLLGRLANAKLILKNSINQYCMYTGLLSLQYFHPSTLVNGVAMS